MEEIIKMLKEYKIITKDGIRCSGNGIIIQNQEELNKMIKEIKTRVYYGEERQKRMEAQLQEIINLLKPKNI